MNCPHVPVAWAERFETMSRRPERLENCAMVRATNRDRRVILRSFRP